MLITYFSAQSDVFKLVNATEFGTGDVASIQLGLGKVLNAAGHTSAMSAIETERARPAQMSAGQRGPRCVEEPDDNWAAGTRHSWTRSDS